MSISTNNGQAAGLIVEVGESKTNKGTVDVSENIKGSDGEPSFTIKNDSKLALGGPSRSDANMKIGCGPQISIGQAHVTKLADNLKDKSHGLFRTLEKGKANAIHNPKQLGRWRQVGSVDRIVNDVNSLGILLKKRKSLYYLGVSTSPRTLGLESYFGVKAPSKQGVFESSGEVRDDGTKCGSGNDN
ncbi:hypothetical protein QYF36_004993 [Acer negundo]|nr:hypothetical protein QYF36_004993 [Acer negundo]